MATNGETLNPQGASGNSNDFSFVGANTPAQHEVARYPTTAEQRRRAFAREEEFEGLGLSLISPIQTSARNTVGPMSLSIALSLQATFSEMVHKLELYQDFDKKCGLEVRQDIRLKGFKITRSRSGTCFFWFLSPSKLPPSYSKGSPKQKALRNPDHADFVWFEMYEFYQLEIDEAVNRVEREHSRLQQLSRCHREYFPRILKQTAEEVMSIGGSLSQRNAPRGSTQRAWRQKVDRQYRQLHEILRTQQIGHEKEINRMKLVLMEWMIDTRNIVEQLLLNGSGKKMVSLKEWPETYSLLEPSDFFSRDDAQYTLVSEQLARMRSGDNFNRVGRGLDTTTNPPSTMAPANGDNM
ncbi:MAG: hypothetical protein M1835_002711 [Candelina submexicana]|nr:MAG: hypothetical protein M1835_002711 [Candelina submexicana]